MKIVILKPSSSSLKDSSATILKPWHLLKLQTTSDRTLPPADFGRRLCQGIYVAESSLYIAIVRTLCAFDIEKVSGQHLDMFERSGESIKDMFTLSDDC